MNTNEHEPEDEIRYLYERMRATHGYTEDEYELIEAELAAFDAKIASGEIELFQPRTDPLVLVAETWATEIALRVTCLQGQFPARWDKLTLVESTCLKLAHSAANERILRQCYQLLKQPIRTLEKLDETLKLLLGDIGVLEDIAQPIESPDFNLGKQQPLQRKGPSHTATDIRDGS